MTPAQEAPELEASAAPEAPEPATAERRFTKALIFTPHPDDAELSGGATMARWASEGTEVVLCVVTNGAMGSNDPAVGRDELIVTRQAEQRAAAKLLGVSDVIFLGYEDGFVEDSHELRRDLIREIRRHRPDVVVGPDPSMFYFGQQYVNHPDHRRVGEAFLAAVNPGATTVPLYRAELYDKGFEPHQVKAVLLSLTTNGDYFVDAEGFLDVKLASLRAHGSQMADWEGLDEFVTGMAEAIAKASGAGYTHAEAFKAFFFD
ncbi:MAG TPA: PIG-L deacetylase family protein [Actinomycetota bacterium]|nr:PIG-L deacetylase family protein [Actinomycetota bacterium]